MEISGSISGSTFSGQRLAEVEKCEKYSEVTGTVGSVATRKHKDSGFWDSNPVEEGIEEENCYDEETGLKIISLEEVEGHNSREDGWVVIYDMVYNLSPYLDSHPGGSDVLLDYLGYDATLAFRGVNHSKAAMRMMSKLLVGTLPACQRLNFFS